MLKQSHDHDRLVDVGHPHPVLNEIYEVLVGHGGDMLFPGCFNDNSSYSGKFSSLVLEDNALRIVWQKL